MPLFFLNNPTYLINHSIFMGRIWTLLFVKNFENSLLPPPSRHPPPSPLVNKMQGGRELDSLSILDKKNIF